MTPLLWAIATFMTLQFVIGVWVSKRVTNESDYLIAGRRLGPLLVTGSLFATWFGAESVVGAAGAAHANGVSIASSEPFAYGLCIILLGVVFAVPLWRRGLTTLADLYTSRYSPLVERVAAVLLIPGSLFWAAAQIRAFGHVLVVSGSGVQLEVALAIATAFVIAYTAVGGLLADATTDILQGVLLTIGLCVLLFAVADAHGGFSAMSASVSAADKIHLLPSVAISPIETVEEWAVPVLGSVVAAELASRVIAARSASVARNSALAAGTIYIAVGMVSVAIGLAAGAIVGPVDDPEQIVHATARTLLSPFMYVVFAGGFLSAILSTVDSTLLVSAGLASHNLVLPALRIRDERTKLRVSRIMVGTFGVIAYGIARAASDITSIVELSSSVGSAGVLVTLAFGLFTNFGGPHAALATLVTGISVFVAATAIGTTAPFLLSLAASVAMYVLVASVEARRSAAA